MRLILSTMLAAALAVTLSAARTDAASKPHQKKAAAAHSMTGCLAKGDEANTYKLTNVAGKGPKTVELIEAPSTIDLNAHVGHKVTITGTTVSPKAAAKAEGTTGKANVKGEATEHHMKVTGLKMVSESCS
ncbi:MAG TPA: hypothetical protein VL225_15395 [Vicinamibacterales bacterium]|jgi:hypothetical protein|nr:hypothetical protein [Vicinamibacterales bacterium]